MSAEVGDAARISAIRRRLRNATEGPWEAGFFWDCEWIRNGSDGRRFRPVSDTSYEWIPSPADALFIANAPSDIAFLLEKLEEAA